MEDCLNRALLVVEQDAKLHSYHNLFNQSQCDVLVRQLKGSTGMVSSMLQRLLDGPNHFIIVKEYYCVVMDANRLLSRCCQKPWLNSAVMLVDAHEDFRSILLDLDLCMLATLTDTGSVYLKERLQKTMEYPEAMCKHSLQDAAQEDQKTLRSKLSQRFQSWTTTRDRLLSNYLLSRLLMNAPTQDGNLQPFFWNPDPQAKVGALLGSGSFGSVHKFTWFGLECAKKSFVCKTEAEEREFAKEAGVMACLHHPNVVRFICCHRDLDERGIVMEYMPMNLDDFIKQRVASSNVGFPFTPMAALDMILQIASGMEYLHGKRVVHRDLKPNNILVSPITIPELGVDGYAKVKLCDFGLAKSVVTSQSEQQSRVCGAMAWRAPEAFRREDARLPLEYRTKEADVYAFAIVCSQILSGANQPFPDPDPWIRFIDRISTPRNERPELPLNSYPAELLDFIKKCWDPDPHQRPNFTVICSSLKNIKLEYVRNV